MESELSEILSLTRGVDVMRYYSAVRAGRLSADES